VPTSSLAISSTAAQLAGLAHGSEYRVQNVGPHIVSLTVKAGAAVPVNAAG